MISYYSQLLGLILSAAVVMAITHHLLHGSGDSDPYREEGRLDPATIKALKAQAAGEKYSRVKPVVNNTPFFLPKIGRDFPDFNYTEMQRRVTTILVSYLRAIDQEDVSLLVGGGEELKQSLKLHLNNLKDNGVHENFDDIVVNRTEISKYFKDPGRCTITFQCSLECKHNKIIDGEVKEGSEEIGYQTRFEIDMVYIQDRDLVKNDSQKALGYNCPNCGAPITSLESKVCEYCGAAIEEYNIKVWTVTAIRECY